MTKIFKKSLVVIMTLAICLTAVMGCFSVGALGTPTITVSSSTGAAGDTVTLSVSGSNFDADICGLELSIDLDGLTFVSATDGAISVTDGSGNPIFKVTDGTVFGTVDAQDFSTVAGPLFSITLQIPVGATDDFTVTPSATYSDETTSTACGAVAGTVIVTGTVVAPELDSAINIGRNIMLTEKFGIRYTLQNANLTKYDSYYLEIKSKHYDASYNVIEKTTRFNPADKLSDSNTTYTYFAYTGTAAYELILDVASTVYATDASGNVVAFSTTRTDTVAARAFAGLTSEIAVGAGMNAQLVTLYVDLVNYGAAAQNYFAASYPGSDLAAAPLANAAFTSYQSYASELPTLVNVNSTVREPGVPSALGLARNVQIGSANYLRYTVAPATYTPANLTLDITYTNSYGIVINETVAITEMELSAGNYIYSFDKIALYDLDRVVTAKIYEGSTLLLTNTYSLESYAYSNISTPALTEILTAMECFGHSAYAYLIA